LTYGVNKYADVGGLKPTIHAEQDAINRLPILPKKKTLANINILVIRISKSGKLGTSKPCEKCIYAMKMLPERRGYRIKNVYYSNVEGNILQTTIRKLESEEMHVTRYWKNNNK
jgi:hypothetical protein